MIITEKLPHCVPLEFSGIKRTHIYCVYFVFNVVHGKLFGQSMVCGCMGKSLVCIGYVSSFTLCWLSLLPGFKGFIGKVVYPPSCGRGTETPGGFIARGGTVFRGLHIFKKKKRGSAERSEAPPREARPREGHREVAITKKLKKVPPESPGEPLIY